MSDLVSVWQGEMNLLGVTLRLHVLDDGTRVIEAQDMEALFEAMERGGPIDEAELTAFARWQHGLPVPGTDDKEEG